MKVQISRYSFYQVPGDRQTLRFVDSYPEKHEHGPVCGCTTDVETRPEGQPDQVQTSIEAIFESGGREYIFSFRRPHGSLDLTVRWPWPDDVPPAFANSPSGVPEKRDTHAHLYLWLNNGFQVELVGTPAYWRHSSVLLCRVFVGEGDLSTMYNGHSKSKVLTPKDLIDKVWVHHGHFGEMVGELVQDAPFWRILYSFFQDDRYLPEGRDTQSVEILHAQTEEYIKRHAPRFVVIRAMADAFIANAPTSELLQKVRDPDRETR